MMTTTHVEALDLALLRPGRIDYKLYLGKASDSQKLDLYLRFFPDASEAEARRFVEACGGAAQTMAEFQGLLLSREQDATTPHLAGKTVVPGEEEEEEEEEVQIVMA